jgi:hypothetical protein
MALSCIAFDPLMFGENFCWRCGKYQYGSSWDTSMIKTIIESGQLGIFFLFRLWYDAIITIINRLLKRENIFQPHRSHLYQYSAEMRCSHVLVAVIYAVLSWESTPLSFIRQSREVVVLFQ